MPRIRPPAPFRRSVHILPAALTCLPAVPAVGAAATSSLLVTKVNGTSTPVVADHLKEGLRIAERERHAANMIETDTPGGLLQSTHELADPGMGFAGAIGVILLVLGFVALSVLPFHIGGLLLLILGGAALAAEVITPGAGVFAADGAVALVFVGSQCSRGGWHEPRDGRDTHPRAARTAPCPG